MKITRIHSNQLDIRIESESETDILGQALARLVSPGVVVGLVGTLGAGKTRLIRSLSESLGVDPGAIASPTFVLIHEYVGRLPVYHFDTYRLDHPDDFEALGASDYWGQGEGICLIEWADRVAGRLPESTWWLRIEIEGPDARKVQFESPEASRLADLLENPTTSAD